MRAVTFEGAGGNEVVVVQHLDDPVAGSNEVVVAVTYAGLNPADVLQREGRYPPPPGVPEDIPGLEVAGTVAECGAQVRGWVPGDRVFGLVAGGGLADRVVAHERHLARIPDGLDDRTAAAVPEAFITAHDAIRTQAGLAMGEVLLVQGASGGVGTAAVQLGVAAGAQVFGVARSEQGRGLVAELGATPLQTDGFADALLDATDGRGADVVLELVGAPNLAGDLAAIARRGLIVVVGVGGGSTGDVSLARLMQRRASIRGTVLRARSLEEKAEAVRAFEREVLPHVADGSLTPVIDQDFDADDVTDAFDHLVQPGKRGKLLLRFG